jgi:uncharacterized protein involved in exopolysaccharide biosynthesis
MRFKIKVMPPRDSDRGGLFGLLIDCRWLMLTAFLACGLATYLLSYLMHKAYRAEALVVPVQSDSSSLSGGLSSLVAATAFTTLGLAPAADKNEALETLQSRILARQFIVERKLLPVICQSKAIDCESQADTPALTAERQMDDAIALFTDDLLGVNEDTVSGAIHISLVWYDRVVAADWCNGMIALTNRRMQESAHELTQKRIEFLKAAYARTDVITAQVAITTLLQTELSRALDSSTRPEFALRVVDPATPPDDRKPARPRKAVLAAVGGVLGALLALAYGGWRRRRHAP